MKVVSTKAREVDRRCFILISCGATTLRVLIKSKYCFLVRLLLFLFLYLKFHIPKHPAPSEIVREFSMRWTMVLSKSRKEKKRYKNKLKINEIK